MATASRRSAPRRPSSPLTPYSLAPEDDLPASAHDVMHTPRKGRRLGGVQMGWDSPQEQDPWSHVTCAPRTVPRAAKRTSHRVVDDSDWTRALAFQASSKPVTPCKRRAGNLDETDEGASAKTSYKSPTKYRTRPTAHKSSASLFDSHGFASAAALAPSTPRLRTSARDTATMSASPIFDAPPPAQAKCDPLAAFQTTSQETTSSSLVAVDVKGMGRVVVDRAMAMRLGAFTEEELKASQGDSLVNLSGPSSEPSHAASSHDSLSTSSMTSTSTHPTSLDTPAAYSTVSGRTGYLDPSPSFSLASHFPASEQESPSLGSSAKHYDVHPQQQQQQQQQCRAGIDPSLHHRIQVFKDKLLAAHTGRAPTAPLSSASSAALPLKAGRPQLGGKSAATDSTHELPTLEWPDDAGGPWSHALDHIRVQEQDKIGTVSRWLDQDFEDEDAGCDAYLDEHTVTSRQRRQQHPMVSKVLRDRSRRSAGGGGLALSESMPNLRALNAVSSRKSNRPFMTPKRRGKLSRGHAHGRTPHKSIRRGTAATPSSAGGASTGSLIGCNCGTEEGGHMVQCDGCHLWYHSRCVGIRDPDTELDDTWFCQPCEGHVSPAHVRSRRTVGSSYGFSPASTIALEHDGAPSTNGSMATTTPSLLSTHGGVPAFPRTYASHVGVGTPSGPYLRTRNNSQAEYQHQLPVFAQAESPMYRLGRSSAGLSLSSAVALAPSPQMENGHETLAGNTRRQEGQGRNRAARIGWQSSEPGSPLDRKSSVFIGSASAPRASRLRTPSFPNKQPQTSNARGGHTDSDDDSTHGAGRHFTTSGTMSPSFFSSMRTSARRSNARDRTPSPSRIANAAPHGTIFSTPSRHARSGRNSVQDEGAPRDADDVFSTPSRHLPGSSWWGARNPNAVAAAHASGGGVSEAPTPTGSNIAVPTTPSGSGSVHHLAGFQTPSRSTRRRESSGWGLGLATPGSGRDRDMLFAGASGGYQSTDVSGGEFSTGGLPSLVFSSGGGIDAVLDDFPAANWGNASPSRIASARRRQRSGVDPLSMPVRSSRTLGSRTSTSSLRSSAARQRTASGRGEHVHFDDDEEEDNLGLDTENEQDPPTSSSPYPRTPSMDLGYSSANRLMAARRGQDSGSTRSSIPSSLRNGGESGRHGGSSTPGSPTPTRGRLASSLGSRKSVTINGFPTFENKHNGNHRGSPTRATRGLSPSNALVADLSQHPSGTGHFGLGLDLDDVLDYF